MSGPRYDLVPEIGAAKMAAAEPAPEAPKIQRSSGYGWAALAIATLIFAFAYPALVPVIWIVAGIKRLMPRLD